MSRKTNNRGPSLKGNRDFSAQENAAYDLIRMMGITPEMAKTMDHEKLMDIAIERVMAGDVDLSRQFEKLGRINESQTTSARDMAYLAPTIPATSKALEWFVTWSDTGAFDEDNDRMHYVTVIEEHTNFIVASELCKGAPTADHVEQTLYKAMGYPMAGQPRRPRKLGVAYRAAKHFDHIVNAMKPLNIAVELQSKEEAEHISSMCGTDAMGRNHDEILPPKPGEEVPRDPAHEYKSKGNKYFQAKKYAKAVKSYTRAIEHAPEDHILYSNRSIANLKLGEAQAALDDADKCLELMPSFSKGHARRGQALEALERWYEARELYARQLVKRPSDVFYQNALARAETALKKNEASDEVD